jgi:hypothetical protein
MLYDIDQRSCSFPIVLALLNQLLLTALCEDFDHISLVSVDVKMIYTHPGDSFVDGRTTCATDDDHHIEPISSLVSDLTP